MVQTRSQNLRKNSKKFTNSTVYKKKVSRNMISSKTDSSSAGGFSTASIAKFKLGLVKSTKTGLTSKFAFGSDSKTNKVVKKTVKFNDDVCKISHFRENTRNVTIAFYYHPVNKTLRYGATVYQKGTGQVWDRKSHMKTAVKRFHSCPVNLVDFSPVVGMLRTNLRKQLFAFGVHGDRRP
jgi:hypothetical protein